MAARAADRRLAAARGRNERVLALARLVLLLREATCGSPPTRSSATAADDEASSSSTDSASSSSSSSPARLRPHPDRRQPLAQPADLYYREQRLCTTCRMASRRSCWSSRGTQGLPVVRDAHLDTTCKERALWALCGVAYGSRNALERFRAAGAFGGAPNLSLAQKALSWSWEGGERAQGQAARACTGRLCGALFTHLVVL